MSLTFKHVVFIEKKAINMTVFDKNYLEKY